MRLRSAIADLRRQARNPYSLQGLWIPGSSLRSAPAQIPGAKISVCHGVGGMFAASGTIIFTNER